MIEETVLCYIKNNNRYLMLFRNKKQNDLNENKWMGVGGHIEKGETPDLAVVREIKEETGLKPSSFSKRGKLLFINDDYEEIIYLYTAETKETDLIDCNEGELKWIAKDNIMNLNMWEGDKIFLPKLLNGDPYFEMKLTYQKKNLIKAEIIQ